MSPQLSRFRQKAISKWELERLFDRLILINGLSLWLFAEKDGDIYHTGRFGSKLYYYGKDNYELKLLEFPDYTLLFVHETPEIIYRLFVIPKDEAFEIC